MTMRVTIVEKAQEPYQPPALEMGQVRHDGKGNVIMITKHQYLSCFGYVRLKGTDTVLFRSWETSGNMRERYPYIYDAELILKEVE